MTAEFTVAGVSTLDEHVLRFAAQHGAARPADPAK